MKRFDGAAAEALERGALLFDRLTLPETERLLTEGGDARIMLDGVRAVNKYGCRPFPDPTLAAFGSSTASVISEAAFAAADQLCRKLHSAVAVQPRVLVYTRELERLRRELRALCGVPDLDGLDIVFSASGTDSHLIAGQLASGGQALRVVMADGVETGSGVPAALAGRHFSTCTALGATVEMGAPIAAGPRIEVATIAVRLADGRPRPAQMMDVEVETLVAEAVAERKRVLVVLTDMSKTGLIAPSPACAAELRRRFPDHVEVLVDACQFRLAPTSLRAYLEQGFMVALTGSKFVGGPTFSGALLIPAVLARRFRIRRLPRTLRAYSARGDWPPHWTAAGALENTANFGLLLRWQAALQELRAFRAVPETAVADFLGRFARVVSERLEHDRAFAPLAAAPLERPVPQSWDRIPTVFPFTLRRRDGVPLSHEQTLEVYDAVQRDLNEYPSRRPAGMSDELAALRCQLGQPVMCGERHGLVVSALRLCAGARLIVAATTRSGGEQVVIGRAMAALDKVALLAETVSS